MRIGYLTYGLDRSPTGIGRYALELLNALAAHPARPELVLLASERRDAFGLWRRLETVRLRGCALLPALMTLGNLWVRQAARSRRLDLIHDPNGIAPFLLGDPAVRHVVTLHDAFPFVQPASHNRLDNWRYRHMLPRALRRTDLVVTDSRHSAADLRRHLAMPEQRLEVIACGINPAFRPETDPARREATLRRYGISAPYALYLGGINARKNIARLLEAFAISRRQHPGLTLVVGGARQWQTAPIDAALDRLDLRGAVCFPGYIDDGDLPALYSAAAVFAFPSLYEGFGLPVLEAMACGAPVVTSNTSSLPEVVGDAALLVDPLDIAAIADALSRVVADSALREELRSRGFARAALFGWDRAADSMVRCYQELLGGAGRATKQL